MVGQFDGASLLNLHPTLRAGEDRAGREGDDVVQFVATGPGDARIDQIRNRDPREWRDRHGASRHGQTNRLPVEPIRESVRRAQSRPLFTLDAIAQPIFPVVLRKWSYSNTI